MERSHLRVLVVTNDLPPRVGGIQYYVDELCRGLVDAGDDVVLLGSSSPGDRDWDATAPYRVVRMRTRTLLPTPLTLHRAVGLVEGMGADVVVFGAAFPLGLLGPAILRRTGVPYLAFTHGLEVSALRAPGGRAMLRPIGRRAGVVTYVSHWCQDLLAPAFGDGPRHELLPPAVSPADFHPAVDGAPVRERHGLGTDPVVVCVSRLVERKGQDQLIRALPELRRRVPGTRLLVVGGGPHRDALEQLAEHVGVADHVTFAGVVPGEELPAYFAAGDVFAMPCRERHRGLEVEAFGIVFIQAQAVGLPVVAGNIGGVPDALRDGDTGVLVDGRDQAAVTDAVASLLEDRDRAAAMGAAGAAFVARGFTWEHRTGQLRRLLQTLASASV